MAGGPPRRSRREVKRTPRPATADDIFDEQLRDACARSIIKYIKECMDTRRPIKSITLPEFKGMAFYCMAEWIKLVSKRLNDDLIEPSQVPVVHNLMFGG